MSRVVIKEESLKNLADAIREKTGTTTQYDIDDMAVAMDSIGTPDLEELTATENGEYNPSRDGYSKVTVDVQPELEELTVIENGEYESALDGYSKVSVNVPDPEQEELVITENGEYLPSTYGFSKVTADVQPELEELTVIKNGEYLPTGDGYSKVTVNCNAELPEEALNLSGKISYLNIGGNWDWFFNEYGDRITTENIDNMSYSFNTSRVTKLPFIFNVKDCANFSNAFSSLLNATESPIVRGTLKMTTQLDFSDFITGTYLVRDYEDLFELEMLDDFENIKVTSPYLCPKPVKFTNDRSMRRVPEWWRQFRLCEDSTAFPYANSCLYPSCFLDCFTLYEIRDIPVWNCKAGQTTNMFSSCFDNLNMAKYITFEPDRTANWSNQVIDLTKRVGYAPGASNILNYNSGLTEDTKIYNDETFHVLDGVEDAWTTNIGYSAFNHDSAFELIESLPDTSAFIAAKGGTNTIKFKGDSGHLTPCGAPNDLSETEIAIAAAKGWTVTLV